MNQTSIAAARQLLTDFPLYARHALSLRSKADGIMPFCLNRAQQHLHDRLEAQIAKKGKVRAIILKGRQQGCSTYVEGRFFHKTVCTPGLRTFILTHEDAASANLFEMVQRFHQYLPDGIKVSASIANAKEMHFDGLDSGYKVGTAGNKAAGRSSTVQLFHGSEVAFWPNAEEHAAGVMQAVPDASGTEIILESTANGLGNYYHRMWCEAERGESPFEAIFIPWYWQDEYTSDADGVDFGFDDRDYQRAYELTDGQLAWRRNKIAELGERQFKQEYPANAQEAFQTTGDNSLIDPAIVLKARKAKDVTPTGSLLIGVDPARFGDDRTSIIRRRNRVAFGLESHAKKDTMEVAGMVAKIIQTEDPARVFIDVGGLGAGVVDRLRELGFGNKIEAVNFGEKALDSDKYRNKRAECWWLMNDWLNEPPVQIPDLDTLHADLCSPGFKQDSNQRRILESKEDIRKRGMPSPDEGDALALTFASPVTDYAENNPYQHWRNRQFG